MPIARALVEELYADPPPANVIVAGGAGNTDSESELIMDIRGHAAIVTGGASGLGAATARMLAAAGAKVAIFDVNQKAAAEVAIDINGIARALRRRRQRQHRKRRSPRPPPTTAPRAS